MNVLTLKVGDKTDLPMSIADLKTLFLVVKLLSGKLERLSLQCFFKTSSITESEILRLQILF